jgi:predicted GIY-YIG superfamily endonuclease
MLYLIEFSKPLGNARHKANYYLGYCEDGRLDERLAEHRSGQGAKITAAAVAIGATLSVVWTGEGDRNDERRLKKRRHHRRLVMGREQ